MLRAVVTGNVWSTKRIEGLPNGAFLELVTENGGAHPVAFDVLGPAIGEHVLVAQGSVAAAWSPGAPPPAAALVIRSIDPPPAPNPTSPAPQGAPPPAQPKPTPPASPPR